FLVSMPLCQADDRRAVSSFVARSMGCLPLRLRCATLGAPISSRLLGCADSSLPVARLATSMHHSNDKDEIGFDGVQNSVRKDTGETATNIVIENPPTLRSF